MGSLPSPMPGSAQLRMPRQGCRDGDGEAGESSPSVLPAPHQGVQAGLTTPSSWGPQPWAPAIALTLCSRAPPLVSGPRPPVRDTETRPRQSGWAASGCCAPPVQPTPRVASRVRRPGILAALSPPPSQLGLPVPPPRGRCPIPTTPALGLRILPHSARPAWSRGQVHTCTERHAAARWKGV